MALRAAAGLLVAALLVWPGVARAGRIVVLQFEGDGPAAVARLSLVRALLDVEGLTLVPQRDYVTEAEAVGVRGADLATPSGVRRAAAVSAVDGVVIGRMVRRGSDWQVRILYYDADGEERLSREYALVRGEMRADDLGRIARFIADRAVTGSSVPVAEAGPAAAPDPVPPSDPDPVAPPDPDPVAPPDPDPWAQLRPEVAQADPPAANPPPATELGGTDWAREPAEPSGPANPVDLGDGVRPVISVRLVGGGGNRQYRMDGPRSRIAYATAGLFPEVGFSVESSPLRGQGRFVEGLGFEGAYSRGFLASSFVVSGTPISLDTPVHRMHLDARWRVRLSSASPMAPEIGVRGGIGVSDFEARVVNAAFTGVRHSGPRVGVEIAQPLAPPWLRLEAWIVALPLSSPGVAERQAYGDDEAVGTGWAARIGLTGGTLPIARGMNWSASVERQALHTRFVGQGTRDNGGESNEVYLAVHAALGWGI